jgi:hypothetical protein
VKIRNIIKEQKELIYSNTYLLTCQERELKMDDDALPAKAQLTEMVDNMEEWQAKLVLSFARTLFGSELTASKEQPLKCEFAS